MNHILLRAASAALVLLAAPWVASAQHTKKNVTLHINTRWSECAFQLDSALTQTAWRRFAEEAGLVAYLRPLSDASPLGTGNVEVSLTRWATAFDDTDPAWNDTFVHPHDTHWLKDGSRLPIPGILVRAGVSERTDVGVYGTVNPESNYGFLGAHVQQNVFQDTKRRWSAAGRLSFVTLLGPEDLDFSVFGMDFLVSKDFTATPWLELSPYAGLSSYLAYAHETSGAVALDDEFVPGSQSMIGVVARVARTRLALEVTSAKVNTVSFKAGVAF